MDRKQKILKYIDKNKNGIEIGPNNNPIASKKDGYNVKIIDIMDKEQLIKINKKNNLDFSNIEKVDFIWKGEKYSKLTKKKRFYDWIIASHVIEHVPDLISFLNNCDEILKEDGVISLAIPDKRYCFDHFRPITGLSKIIDAYYQKNKINTAGTIIEHYLNIVSNEKNIAWTKDNLSENYNFIHSSTDAFQKMIRVVQKKEYLDTHAWCFVPHSFRLIISDLFNMGFIPFKEVEFFPTEGHEFFVTLSRRGKGINKSRLEMLKIIEYEVSKKNSKLRHPISYIILKIRKLLKKSIF